MTQAQLETWKRRSSTMRANQWSRSLGVLMLVAAGRAIVPGPAAHAAGKPAIAVAVADQKSLFYIAAVAGMRDEAKKEGYTLNVASAADNSTLQINQIQNLLVRQPGALIFIPQDATSAAAGVRAANQSGVPVIAVDERPEGTNVKLATYIATDSVKAARDLCTWMFNQIGGKGELAILHGVLGATAELQRTQGCQEALQKFPDIHVVAQQTANWDETEAYKAAQNILTAHPDLKAIFGESDAMAMGAAKAAKQADRQGLVVVGIDGFPTMFKAVKSGLTQATKAQRPYEMGEMAVRDAIQLINNTGKAIPAEQLVDAQLITKANVDQFSPTTFYGPTANTMY
ncbi:substrate-binding domain-containing protein [Lichenicoccus roseus]|uniref:Substrate-binding domain-containing protein n=2 Tax=Lichenicoccus roseus TaxID=2683649 RepID=A0A5R9J6T8_9PROT|nr:substrate-binding domain-containing protein [Lichenicoccus roseus]